MSSTLTVPYLTSRFFQRLSSEMQHSIFYVTSSQSDFFLIASRRIDRITPQRPPSSPCTTRSSRQYTLVMSALSSFWRYHLYSEDTQVIASTTMTHAELTVDRLQQCVAEIQSTWSQRSTSSQQYEWQRTCLMFGERSFSCAGPRAWNSLPSSLNELTDICTFKRHLKTVLFIKRTNNALRIHPRCLGLHCIFFGF